MSFSEDVTDLQCSVCLCRFNDPIILNCGHTFDRLCIQKIAESAGSSRCPLCCHEFNLNKPLISNKSLVNIIKSEPTFECFLIDISFNEESKNVLTFLKLMFAKRDILETNSIIFQTVDARLVYNSNLNFDQELKIKSLLNLEKTLQEVCTYLQEQDVLRKICILTDGSTNHLHVTKIDSDVIKRRWIIHIGDKNISRTRQLADRINFQFGYFNKKTLEIYVDHFLTNF